MTFFGTDVDGGVNMSGKNGYVKDCTSLGPDVIPEGGVRLVPKAVSSKKATPALKATAAPQAHAQLYSTNFYNTLGL